MLWKSISQTVQNDKNFYVTQMISEKIKESVRKVVIRITCKYY